MAAETTPKCSYGSSITGSKSYMIRLGRCFSNAARNASNETEAFLQEWTPFLLVMSYFVFSISLYTFCTQKWIEMFWFLYLTANFYIAGSTVLEALMSVKPCRDARIAVRKVSENNWVFPTPDLELVFLDLLIVSRPVYSSL